MNPGSGLRDWNARIFVLLALSSGFAGQAVEGGPALILETERVDLGNRYAGERIPVRVGVRNGGGRVLKIDAVYSSCDCLLGEASWPGSLPPGGAGAIQFEVDALKLQGDFTKKVFIVSNASTGAKAVLELKGTVERIFVVNPWAVSFGEERGEATARERVVRIHNATPEPFALKVGATLGAYRCSLRELTPGRKWDLTIAVDGELPEGHSVTPVWVETTHPRHKRFSVEVSAHVAASVQIIPPKLEIPSMPLTRAAKRIVSILSREGEGWRIQGVESDDPRLHFTTEVFDTQIQRVIVHFPAGYVLKAGQSVAVRVQCIKEGSGLRRDLQMSIFPAEETARQVRSVTE